MTKEKNMSSKFKAEFFYKKAKYNILQIGK